MPPSEAYPEWRESGRRDSAGEESAVGVISKIATSDVAKNSKKEESPRKPGLEIKWKTSKNNRNVFL